MQIEKSIYKTVQKLPRRGLTGIIAVLALSALPLTAGEGSPGVRQIFDKQLSFAESEVMGVVETMPANKFGFTPTEGAFQTVRTFGVQACHIAFCLNEAAVALLGEPMLPPVRKGRGILPARMILSAI
ncbi:MAG TPA: hypothetical protein VLY24_16865 [Bryobacteraceae bacterium]|nr:hypothetical protein [Bryobacteraceae bacterium]HUI79601.1 hypothetical protein [Bryobacteraceae bacterium]